MATIDADEGFWGFLCYVKENPHKDVNWESLHAMAKMWAVENATSLGLTAATALSHANEGLGVVDFSNDSITFPVYAAATRVSTDAGGTTGGSTLAANKLICAGAMYPEKGI